MSVTYDEEPRPNDPICPKHGLPVELVRDPFMWGVWNEAHMVWLCPECAQDRADDI